MAYLPLRGVALPDAPRQAYDAWLDELAGRIAEPGAAPQNLLMSPPISLRESATRAPQRG